MSFYITAVCHYIMVKRHKLMLRYTLTDTYTTQTHSLSFKKLWGAPHQFTKTNNVLQEQLLRVFALVLIKNFLS